MTIFIILPILLGNFVPVVNTSPPEGLSAGLYGKLETVLHDLWAYYYAPRDYHGTDAIVHFESDNRIGVAWLSANEKGWTYNFLRVDTTGRVLLDLRKFQTKEDYLKLFGIDWENGVPQLEYVVDENSNSWLIYSYYVPDSSSWQTDWLEIGPSGEILEDVTMSPVKRKNFIAFGSSKVGFHLFLPALLPASMAAYEDYLYYNPGMDHAVSIGWDFISMKTGVEIDDSHLLLLAPPGSNRLGQESFEYCILSESGEIIRQEILPFQKYIRAFWQGVELPAFCEAFKAGSTVNFLFPHNDRINLVTFTEEGKLVTPERTVTGTVLRAKNMPTESKRFIKIYKGIVYLYGIDDLWNMYYWNSRTK
jgi:hypothetical protein